MAFRPRLVLGLGNPTEKYTRTRHNIGRRFIDYVADSKDASYDLIRQTEVFRLPNFFGIAFDEPILFARLTSFMNESGPALKSAIDKFGVTAGDVLVILDDFMIPFGELRLRTQGSSGGHNGLKSLIETFGTEEIPRLRVGIGPTPPNEDPADFVLRRFSKSEESRIDDLFKAVEDSLTILLRDGYDKAMNAANKVHFQHG